MNFFTTAALSVVMLGAANMSHATTIDFSGFPVVSPTAGSDVNNIAGTNVNLGGGIVADIGFTEGVGAVIFDTTPGTQSASNDSDLVGNIPGPDGANNFVNTQDPNDLRDFGNVLIVQEDQTGQNNPSTGPDDRGAGGSLTFDFASLISLDEVFLLDSFTGTTVTLLLGDTIVQEFELGNGQNGTIDNQSDTSNSGNPNEFSLLDFGGAIGDSFIVEFARSGGLGEFSATALPPVPLPASLPLLAGGFGVLAFMRRRRKAA